jgi:plasmid maintenance system antidote protein VapI
MTFGERFKHLRETLSEKHNHKRRSQRGFAETIGVIGPTISNIESDQYKMNAEILIRLKEEYPEVNMNWLLVEEGKPFSNEYPSVSDEVSAAMEDTTNYQTSKEDVLKKIPSPSAT